jgi:hypothetical protein
MRSYVFVSDCLENVITNHHIALKSCSFLFFLYLAYYILKQIFVLRILSRLSWNIEILALRNIVPVNSFKKWVILQFCNTISS